MKKMFLIEEIRYSKTNHGYEDESENVSIEPFGYFVGTEEEAHRLCEQIKQSQNVKDIEYEVYGDDLDGMKYPIFKPLELKQLTLK